MNWSYVTGFFDGEGSASIRREGSNRWFTARLSFANTNLQSLKDIQAFINCGNIIRQGRKKPHYRTVYRLDIWRWRDVRRVARCMLRHSIVKREALRELLHLIETHKWNNRGKLDAIDPARIRAMYDAGLSASAIGRHLGFSEGGIFAKMIRSGIRRRPAGGVGPTPRLSHAASVDLYLRQRLTAKQVARRVGMTESGVLSRFVKLGIPRRTRWDYAVS